MFPKILPPGARDFPAIARARELADHLGQPYQFDPGNNTANIGGLPMRATRVDAGEAYVPTGAVAAAHGARVEPRPHGAVRVHAAPQPAVAPGTGLAGAMAPPGGMQPPPEAVPPASAAEVITHLVGENAAHPVHAHAIVSQYGHRLPPEERHKLAQFLHARFPVPGGVTPDATGIS